MCDAVYQGTPIQQARFLCTECDEKMCETCWDRDHKNKKRGHHQKLLLFFECYFCPKDKKMPALYYCTPCNLMLCKQCWYNEHKAPRRRKHNKQFLYPPDFSSVQDTQGLDLIAGRFDPKKEVSFFMTKGENRACSVCNLGGEGRAALFKCTDCDERMCEPCWHSEHQNMKRRNHKQKLMLFRCDCCGDVEGRPAFYNCVECKLMLCEQCWPLEHRHPSRRPHKKENL